MLRPDEQKREHDHCIQEIRVPHSEKHKTAEHIDQRAAEICCRVPVPHPAAEAVKTDSRQIHSQNDHGVVEKAHMLLRHKHCRQAEGISDHVVLQGREKIRPVAHMHIECRKSRLPRQ